MNKSVSGGYVLLGHSSNVTSGNATLHPLRCVIVKLWGAELSLALMGAKGKAEYCSI